MLEDRCLFSAFSLFTDSSLATPGLTGSYLNRNLRSYAPQDDWRVTQQPVSGTRVDPAVDFQGTNWGSRSSVGITGGTDADWDLFSVQWDGYVQVNTPGTTLATRSDDGSRMWIDVNHDGVFGTAAPEFVNNNWGNGQPATIGQSTPPLAAGVYKIRIQYEEGYGGNVMQLLPRSPVTTLSSTQWTPAGPAPLYSDQAYTGRIASLAAHPTDPKTLYIAAAGGGVWKTTDGGASWTPLTDNQASLAGGAVALAPSNPNVVYFGTGEPNHVGGQPGRGLLRSNDAGATWTLLGASIFSGASFSQIVVSPSDPNTVYAATVDGTGGVWKTTNGGTTWVNTTAGIANVSFSDLVMDPSNPQVLYAAAGSIWGAAANGVYKTTNGGGSWTRAGNFTGGSSVGRISLAIAKSSPQTLYAAAADTSAYKLLRVAKSTDGGATWNTLPNVPNYMGNQGDYDQTLAVAPTDANVVYAGGQGSLITSSDGGTSWAEIGNGTPANGPGPHWDHHAIGFDAAGRLLDGNDGGIWRLDGPAVGNLGWANLNANLQITQFEGVALDPTNPLVAYCGSQDNGTEKYTGFQQWQQIAGGDGGVVRVDPSNPKTVYHTYTNASIQRSDDGGTTFTDKNTGISASDPTDFYVPYVLDPSSPSRLLLGTNRVYETTNRGDSWTPISTPNANGWTTAGTIDAIALAPGDPNTVYATTQGHVFVTTNHGAQWADRTPAGVSHFPDAVADPTNPLTAYLACSDASGGRVWKTTNGGGTWTDISANLPAAAVWSIALDVGNAGPSDDALYVGTDQGVWASYNGGVSWQPPAAGLPNVRVQDLDLVANNNYRVLAAGTHGRGLWLMALPGAVAPPAPGALYAKVKDPGAATLSFNDNSTNESGFAVEASTDGGQTFSLLHTLPASAGTGLVTDPFSGLDPSKTYRLRVRALAPAGSAGVKDSPATNVVTVRGSGPSAFAYGTPGSPGAGGAGGFTADAANDLFSGGNGGGAAPFTASVTAAPADPIPGRLRLNDGNNNESHTALTSVTNAVVSADGKAGFTTSFDFQLTNPDADGFAFVLAGSSPTAAGGAGGGLGYLGIPNSVAVTFSEYYLVTRTGVGVNGVMPAGSYGPLDMSASLPGAADTWWYGGFHALDASGRTEVYHVTLSYDPTQAGGTLHEAVTGLTTGKTYAHDYTGLNLASVLGDRVAYVGFTGGTGALNGTHEILNWSYTPPTPAAPSWLAVPAGGTWSLTGPAGGQTLTLTGGAFSLNTDPAATNPGLSVVTSGPASLAINANAHLAGLTLSGGATATLSSVGAARSSANHRILVTSALSIDAASGSKLDLADNDMVLKGGGAAGLASVQSLISSGYSKHAWNGSGIVASAAAGKTANALGYARNDGSVIKAKTNFGPNAEPVGPSDVLVKYTWEGDSNLDGQVSFDDYFYIDSKYPKASGSTWVTGDFDYNAQTSFDDYFYIDSNYPRNTTL